MIKIGIMGYGVVGSGLIEVIDKNRELNNAEIEITSILVKDKNECIGYNHYEVITDNAEEFFNSDHEVVIELIGGINPAFEYVKRALENKKHVVTANKDLIAAHGPELFKIANENCVALKFEAAVGGCIPIIKPMTESLKGNEVNSIKAILNGTTNFILTKMDSEGLSYDEALKEAQRLGFAEANPESDVMGYDAARKLAILSTLAFDKKVHWESLNIKGITDIDSNDFKYAKQYNCKIKLVGEANKNSTGIYASLKPVLVQEDNILSKIDNEVNAVILNTSECGDLTFIGKGAGKLPTGSIVYGDMLDIINHRFSDISAFNEEEAIITKYSNSTCNCIVRVNTKNKEATINDFRNYLNNIRVIDRNVADEVAIYIECVSEAFIQTLVEKIKSKEYYISSKKLIFI